jgi:hypothetical protein
MSRVQLRFINRSLLLFVLRTTALKGFVPDRTRFPRRASNRVARKIWLDGAGVSWFFYSPFLRCTNDRQARRVTRYTGRAFSAREIAGRGYDSFGYLTGGRTIQPMRTHRTPSSNNNLFILPFRQPSGTTPWLCLHLSKPRLQPRTQLS